MFLTVAFGDEDANSRYDCTVQRTGAVGTATVDVFLLYDAKSEQRAFFAGDSFALVVTSPVEWSSTGCSLVASRTM